MRYIGILLLIGIAFVSGYFTSSYITHEGVDITVSPVGTATHTLLQPEILSLSPKDPERHYKLEQCFINNIEIEIEKVDVSITQSNPFVYRITASDKCKQTTQDFRVEVGQKGNWNFYIGMAIGAGMIATAVILLR